MIELDDRMALVAWSDVEGAGPRTLARLRARLGGLAQAWHAPARVLVSQGGLAPDRAIALVQARDARDPVRLWQRHLASGLDLVLDSDARFPDLLRHIPVPPLALWTSGDLGHQERAIAIVGTRRPTPYGCRVAARLAGELAARGVVVVSGLALGIDAEAHAAALARGRTWAVLGSALDRIHPVSHRELARRIVRSGGCLISEYPPGTGAAPWRFPARNRLVAGLCRGTVVVEAPERSGALLTAAHALEQDREVLGVPGPVDSTASAGVHRLLREGARLVRDVHDILMEFGWEASPEGLEKALEGDQAAIWAALGPGARPVDMLPGLTGLPAARVQAALTHLLLAGRVAMGSEGWHRLA